MLKSILTIENEADEVMGFKGMVESNDKGVVEFGTDILLIFNDILLLCAGDKFLQHDFHGIKIAIP